MLYSLRKGKFGVTSPLLKTGSLPLSPHVTFLGYPPLSPLGMTSFMDGPLWLKRTCMYCKIFFLWFFKTFLVAHSPWEPRRDHSNWVSPRNRLAEGSLHKNTNTNAIRIPILNHIQRKLILILWFERTPILIIIKRSLPLSYLRPASLLPALALHLSRASWQKYLC